MPETGKHNSLGKKKDMKKVPYVAKTKKKKKNQNKTKTTALRTGDDDTG